MPFFVVIIVFLKLNMAEVGQREGGEREKGRG
jgi:hypothetical protein